MKQAGCEVKFGKHIAFKLPDGKKFLRLDSLGEGYSEAEIREWLMGTSSFTPKRKSAEETKSGITSGRVPKLLIDIEAKIQMGYGTGFEHYARVQNLKEMAKTLIFLRDNGIGTYEELVKKQSGVSAKYIKMNERRKEIENRLAAITELQKHIGYYGKSRDIYMEYKAKKFNQDFFEEHREPLTLHIAAKKHFDELGLKKIPSITSLKQEYAMLLAEKKSLGNIKVAHDDMIAWRATKYNVDRFLGEPTTLPPKKYHDRDAR